MPYCFQLHHQDQMLIRQKHLSLRELHLLREQSWARKFEKANKGKLESNQMMMNCSSLTCERK